VVGEFRGLVRASARRGDELCNIAGPGCPYTLPVGGKPLIAQALKAVCDAGAREILVAVDASIAEVVVPAIGELTGAEVHAALQPEGDDDATMRAVEKVLGAGPLIFMAGDTLAVEGARAPADPADDTVFELETAWAYDGTVDGVLEANTIALDALKRGRVGVDLSNASVQGRVQIDPSAELAGAKLRGPVYIGPGARLVETYVGPYTTIGAGVTLEGVEIEHSIVLPGAQIRYPGRRLEASLVGEGAQIGRDYSLPSALRLRVGPGSEIQLS
jgi:NDP-sugar pyrophosphorylase family protein